MYENKIQIFITHSKLFLLCLITIYTFSNLSPSKSVHVNILSRPEIVIKHIKKIDNVMNQKHLSQIPTPPIALHRKVNVFFTMINTLRVLYLKICC